MQEPGIFSKIFRFRPALGCRPGIAKIAGNLPDDARERILVFAQGVSAGASLRDDRKGEENNGEKTK